MNQDVRRIGSEGKEKVEQATQGEKVVTSELSEGVNIAGVNSRSVISTLASNLPREYSASLALAP